MTAQEHRGASAASDDENVLVSVVITCYNHAHFLPDSVGSVLKQDYPHIEIVLIDDGSTDNTAEVAQRYSQVKYFYQQNAGLSAARNTGIEKSTGAFITFLDADDWLYDGALSSNVAMLLSNPDAAFSSGCYDNLDEKGGYLSTYCREVFSDHYMQMFRLMNYIGMHATVMYRRSILREFQFDTSLRACEDYDIYLRILRDHQAVHQRRILAGYRRHTSSMSSNIPHMYYHVVRVLDKQKPGLRSAEERYAFEEALKGWKHYFVNLLSYQPVLKRSDILFLLKKNPVYLFKKTVVKKIRRNSMKKYVPHFVKRAIHMTGAFKNFVPGIGKISFGDFSRVKPFSKNFGYNRGGPIDRYYIENFLDKYASRVKGKCLEIGDNEYTLKYGKAAIQHSDILHIDPENTKATIIGDLSNAPQIPDNTYDCIVLTQTLHLIYDFESALRTCHRVLKPGGTMLITVPGISNIDYDEWGSNWMWSFTEASLRMAISKTFPNAQCLFEVHGNVYAASCFLYGVGLPEVKKEKLNFLDPHYPVIIAGSITKA